MEFIIIATLVITLGVYSWWGGYKMGERKGRRKVIEEIIKLNTGDTTCEKENTQ